jgi:hypothetical protein
MNRPPLAAAFVALLMVLLVACGGGSGAVKPKRLDQLLGYGSAVRWNDFDEAWDFVDPAVRAARPLSDFERERYRQIQVTGYDVRNQTASADGLTIEQTVEISLVNRNTQVERIVTDHQRWVFNPETKRWWLASGLPDFFGPR